ncbi:MAG: DUF4364 family protein [Clostridia bacterium]|nr:DUF4364 family protein [Clostridia bacterium]
MYENKDQELQNNILVLYVLGSFEIALSEQSLNELILSPGLINYFSYRESLSNLAKSGFVSAFSDNDGLMLYSITEEGRISLSNMESLLAPHLKAAYDEELLKMKSRIIRETSVNAYPFIDVNKNQSVRCYIREKGNKIVDLRFPVPDQEIAEAICENWKTDAYGTLTKVILLMSEDV